VVIINQPNRKPPSVDDAKVQALLKALRSGHYVERAARLSNVSVTTIYRWLDEVKK
jgi:transposase